MKKIAILGGYGDGITISEFIEEIGEFEIIGYLNDFEKKDTIIGNYPVLETCDNWKKLPANCYFTFIMQRFLKMQERYNKLKQLAIPLEKFANIIHPKAHISKSCKLGSSGIIVYPYATIYHSTIINNFCSIRSGANIGHDCILGEFNYVGPNAVLSGYTQTEEGVYIAPNATINSSISLKKFSMAGSNSVIYKNIDEYQIYQGNPARFIGKTNEQNV